MATNDDHAATLLKHSHLDLPKTVAMAAGVYALIAGVVTLLGWILNRPRLTDWMGTGVAMFPNTAVCTSLSGVGLILLASRAPNSSWCRAIRILGCFVALVGGLTLFQHVSGINLGIDMLVSDQSWGQRAAASPMRMGPPASTSFLILGLVLALATAGPQARRKATAFAIVPLAIASLSLIGYWFGSDPLYTVVHITASLSKRAPWWLHWRSAWWPRCRSMA